MEKKLRSYKFLVIITHLAKIFFGTLFWIHLIGIIIINSNIFTQEFKLFVLSVLFFIIALYIILTFDKNSKYAKIIAVLPIIFGIIGTGLFGYYTFIICKLLPVMTYIPSIVLLLGYNISKELYKQYKKLHNELEKDMKENVES